MSSFSREELIALRERAREMSQVTLNPSWKRAYQDLAHAASVLDAFIARSTQVQENPKECCGGQHEFKYVNIREQEKEGC